MKYSSSPPSLTLLTALLIVCACMSENGMAQTAEELSPQTITVAEYRPVARALQKLEQVYGLPITFEDTQHPHDWAAAPINEKGFHQMHSENLTFTYEAPLADADLGTRKGLAANALGEILKNYNTAHNSEVFTMAESAEGFHVVAHQFTNASGQQERLHPLLDTPISIDSEERTSDQLLGEIAKSINSVPRQFAHASIGIFDVKGFTSHRTSITATNEPARDVLERLLSEMPVVAQKHNPNGSFTNIPASWSWQLFCDPDPQWGCALSIHSVKPLAAYTPPEVHPNSP